MSKILIIEDEEAIADLEKDYLELSGFEVEIENRGDVGLKKALEGEYDLFILDLMLPEVDGFEICREIRNVKNTPIIMVSAKKDDIDKIRGLGLGADDYITKPFGSAELLARIRTSLRHSTRMNTSSDQLFHPYKCGELILDFEKRTLTISGNIVHLTPIEYKILVFLAQNCGKVMTYSSIINNVWGPYADDNNRILRVNMTNIRRKIEKNPADPQYIFTEVGVGYRMNEEHC